MDETDIHRTLNEILNLRSLVTLIPDPKHDNADAISRCFNPHYCSCDLEIFKCFPCKKGLSRATLSIEREQNNSISTPLDTAKREVTRKKQEESSLSDCTLEKPISSTLHRLQIEDPDIYPVLQQKLKNERPSRNEQNTYSVATRHYLAQYQRCILV